MDNTTIKGASDRLKVSARQEWELANMREKFNVNTQQVTDAINAVGNDRKKIEAYLLAKQPK